MEGTWVIYASRFAGARANVAMRWERRGDFARLWNTFAEREDAPKKRPRWRSVKKRNLAWYDALIDELKARAWIRVEAPAEPAIAAVPDGRQVRLRVDKPDPDLPLGGDVRIVRPRESAGLQLARLIAKAVGTPVAEMSGAQRHLRQRIGALTGNRKAAARPAPAKTAKPVTPR